MSTTAEHILYGQPPRGLVEIAPLAVQCSPLVPGAIALEMAAEAPGAVVYAPPGVAERRYVLARVLMALRVGATLTALAPKDKGGSRIAAELKAFGCAVVEDSRKHHRVVVAVRPAVLSGIDEAIAAGGLRQYPQDGLWTQPGVFSWDRLDAGSSLLLKHLPVLSGAGADIGCGIGVLARAVLGSPTVTSLTLVDIDRRAVDAAKRNVTDPRAAFAWADVRVAPLPAALDFVVMNPPFHDTGIEDQSLGQTFIARASEALKKGGQCWLVANRHLPYEALLAQRFARVALMDMADGFKIYRAEK